MKMKCLYTSIIRGDVVRAGQVVDISQQECENDIVKRFFVSAEPDVAVTEKNPPVAAAINPSQEIVVAGLTREQAIQRLHDARQRIGANISNARLKERFEEFFGQTTADK